MGKGTFLTDRAKANPGLNFLGIEYARWFLALRQRPPSPQRLHQRAHSAGGGGIFPSRIRPAGSVSIIHIYFPIPGPRSATTNAD